MSKDNRVKSIFTVSVEWSDYSPHSPMRTGQLPLAAVVPGGERVEITCRDIQVTQWNRDVPYNSWVKMGHGISAKESGWGDDGSRSYGRSGATVEVLAPEGTKFVFEQGCDYCGEFLGEIGQDELVHGRAPKVVCDACQEQERREQELMEAQRQEEREYYQERTLLELEGLTGVRQLALNRAANKGTLNARKSASVWLSSVADVEFSIEQGYIRAPKKAK